jgi:hypothetical protein
MTIVLDCLAADVTGGGGTFVVITLGQGVTHVATSGTPNFQTSFPRPTLVANPAFATPTANAIVAGNVITFPNGTTVAGTPTTITISGMRVNVAAAGASGDITAQVDFGGGLATGQGVVIIANAQRALDTRTDQGYDPTGFRGITGGVLGTPTVSGINSVLQLPGCSPAATPSGTPSTFANANITGPDAPLNSTVFFDFRTGRAGILRAAGAEDYLVTPPLNAPGGTGIGLPHGTRLLIKLTGVPTGFNVYALRVLQPTAALGTGGSTVVARRVAAAELDGSGGALTALPSDLTQFDLISPSGTGEITIVYEVTTTSGAAGDLARAPVVFTGASTSSTGNIQAQFGLGPTGPGSTAAALPQFAALSSARTVATLVSCISRLLFNWVAFTGEGQVNTGIAISNTSLDPFGTAPQTGFCELNFYRSGSTLVDGGTGTNPAKVRLPAEGNLEAGKTALFIASSLGAPFTGYAIASCNFSLAHGFASIAGGGLNQAYVANSIGLVRPNPESLGN